MSFAIKQTLKLHSNVANRFTMFVNNFIKAGSFVAKTAIVGVKVATPYVAAGVNHSVRFAKKEKALASQELDTQGKLISKRYAEMNKQLAVSKKHMLDVYSEPVFATK